MNRPLDLRVTVPRFSQTVDGKTFQYHVVVNYGFHQWELLKRFSDFDKLVFALEEENYGCIPALPANNAI